jgi:hypothetical protein
MEDQNQNPVEGGQVNDQPETLTIGEEQLAPDEAQRLINRAREIEGYEKQWNTSVDKVWPAYTRLSQEKGQLEGQLKQYQDQLSQFQQKQQAGTDTPSDHSNILEKARKIGILTKNDIEQAGYLTKEQAMQLVQEQLQQNKQQEQFEQEVNKGISEIMSDIKETGKPKVTREAILGYMHATGVSDPKQAYEQMYKEDLEAWKAAQVQAKQKKSYSTVSQGGGNKQPAKPSYSRENALNMIEDMVSSV